MLRKHQRDATALATDPGIGRTFNRILAAVTPGGGKSSLPIIIGRSLISRNIATRICWVVPRKSLRSQGESAFMDQKFRLMFNHAMEIRASGNERDPSRGTFGYSTTYQAISANPDLHEAEFRRHRYMIVLDEIHHAEDGGVWHEALAPLVKQAAFVLLMSGTLSRDDGKRIAFLDYDPDDEGRFSPCLEDTETTRAIRYTRKDGLAEQAILPIYFERMNASARWRTAQGVEKEVGSLSGIGPDGSAALFTILRQDYARDLMLSMIEHWREAKQVNSRAKFLVVAPGIALAKAYLQMLVEMGVTHVDVATSDDSDEAKINIDRLKGRHRHKPLDGLVTVGMAYEGLDCPEITHIASLTQIRSHEWIEQMLARATRVDYKAGPYETQAAHVWAPDDDAFTEAVRTIQGEQLPFIREAGAKRNMPLVLIDDEAGFMEALGSDTGATRAVDMQTGEIIDPMEYERLRALREDEGLAFLSMPELKRIVAEHDGPTLTMSERETEARKALDRRIKQVTRGNPAMIKSINGQLIRRFRKPRAQMTLTMLNDAAVMVDRLAG